ncbi:hypothetical protein [Methanobrevibacter sp.]|uniref:hypothetical protein n=1 Tax=Methanobrevibacter sp. TaxID=66852 RepID=UPI0038693CD0
MKLTISKLREEAIQFCKRESAISHEDLVGITDGKAIGTYIEHKFEEYLNDKYEVTIGSSGKGIDLPDAHINTDIKVTSIKNPQSSTPFKNIEQKIYGLGHNLLIFVYKKNDINNKCYLGFKHCIFLKDENSGDYTLTKILRKMVQLNANESDIMEILEEYNVPGDKQNLKILAKKILSKPPKQGYLTISNACQWRLKYNNIFKLKNELDGVYTNKKYNEKELEDYQTPSLITDKICDYLKNYLKIQPDVIIEPTCGIGNFLKSASNTFKNQELYGIEIDKKKLNNVNRSIPNLKLINEDIFQFKFDMINKNDSYLIIGNPPWITDAKLDNINCGNIRNKFDFKNNKTNDINTEINNFEISEYIILRIINEFKDTKSTIAIICKTIVSKNIFKEVIKNNIPYSFVKQLNFNYSTFDIDEEICLFIMQFGGMPLTNKICEVTEFSNPEKILYKISFKSDKNHSNDNVLDIDGKCKMKWREGIKHDCAKIIELTCENSKLINNLNETVLIEKTLLYPLLKTSNLNKPIVNDTSKYIIITQQKIRQDTKYIKTEAPKTWEYLNKNKKYFDKRKSKTYKKTPDFSIFGIGKDAFKKYKVVISSYFKKPKFSLVYSAKAIMLDDSCYYLSFENYDDAYITMLILNSQLVKIFLKNIAFLDAKRPFSKKILKRIDFDKCLKILKFDNLKKTENELRLDNYITPDKFDKYKKKYEN